MRQRFTGQYPPDWGNIAQATKTAASWCCIRCGKKHDRPTGQVLTCHHWDNDKGNCRWWNVLALCQRCHLTIQGKVSPFRPWVYDHSEWFQPYVAGYYASRYLGLDLTREEVMDRLNELLALEARAVLGRDPIALDVAR